jgi:hypothetical protein
MYHRCTTAAMMQSHLACAPICFKRTQCRPAHAQRRRWWWRRRRVQVIRPQYAGWQVAERVTEMQEIIAACRTFRTAPMWRWPWRARWIAIATMVVLAGPGIVASWWAPLWSWPALAFEIAAIAVMIRWREPLQRWMGRRIARAVWR